MTFKTSRMPRVTRRAASVSSKVRKTSFFALVSPKIHWSGGVNGSLVARHPLVIPVIGWRYLRRVRPSGMSARSQVIPSGATRRERHSASRSTRSGVRLLVIRTPEVGVVRHLPTQIADVL